MLIVIDKHSGVPIFRQVIDQIKHQILTGVLKEGSMLTSVRDLSGSLQINPMTVSKSYSLLENEGYVSRRRGVGLFVSKPQQDLTRKAKLRALEELLIPAAVQAAHMDIEEQELLEMLVKLHKTYRTKGSKP